MVIINMMQKFELTIEEHKQQLEFRKNYQFFKGPMLDVYGFCFWLHESLFLDGFRESNPNEIMSFFWDLAEPHIQSKGYVIEAPINGMTAEKYICYPEGKTTLLHIAPIAFFIHDFIYCLGRHYLGIDHKEKNALYSYWIGREQVFTFTLLHTMLAQFRDFVKKLPNVRDLLIDLHVSTCFESSGGYLGNIKKKNELHEYAKVRIASAIGNGYFLEAITLAESIIADRLSMAMFVRGYNSKSKSFNQLILDSKDIVQDDLICALDSWRKNRNFAIHNLVRTSPLDSQISPETFLESAKDAAILGSRLVVDVDLWFYTFIDDEMSPFNIWMSSLDI